MVLLKTVFIYVNMAVSRQQLGSMQRNYIHGANFRTALNQPGAAAMIRLACFGAFFVALALTGPVSATGDVESGVEAHLKGLVSAMDGSKVCPFGTCARLHPGQLPLAAPTTGGVGNP